MHGMQTRSSDENSSVCLSVCLSVKRVICDKMEERFVQILHHMKDRLAWISEKKNGWWGSDPFYLKFWANQPPLERNRRFSTSALTPSEKSSINTNRKSTTRFPMSLR